MESSIKTVLLEFKILHDQVVSFEDEIILKLKEKIPNEELLLIFKQDNLPLVSYYVFEVKIMGI